MSDEIKLLDVIALLEDVRRGLPEDFIEDLSADIEAFEQAVTQIIIKRGAQVAATAAIDLSIESGTNAVRELDAIARNLFAADPAALAAWLSASHVQRTPRRASAPAGAPAPAPAG